MRIGSRWHVGGDAPAGLPEQFVAAVRQVERDAKLTSGEWTLTWLEGRPIAEHPQNHRVLLGADGAVHVTDSAAAAAGTFPGDGDDDDDDWLR